MPHLRVNGIEHHIETGMRTLLAVLRDDLGLVGAKEGCGIGMCGACTVLVADESQRQEDSTRNSEPGKVRVVRGKAVSSCLLLAAQCDGKEITTIEGLAQNGQLHRVQQAFLDHAAFQCAFCTPGFILATVALLKENPTPNEEEIREYLSANLCRCGSYQNILKAVKDAARRAK